MYLLCRSNCSTRITLPLSLARGGTARVASLLPIFQSIVTPARVEMISGESPERIIHQPRSPLFRVQLFSCVTCHAIVPGAVEQVSVPLTDYLTSMWRVI